MVLLSVNSFCLFLLCSSLHETTSPQHVPEEWDNTVNEMTVLHWIHTENCSTCWESSPAPSQSLSPIQQSIYNAHMQYLCNCWAWRENPHARDRWRPVYQHGLPVNSLIRNMELSFGSARQSYRGPVFNANERAILRTGFSTCLFAPESRVKLRADSLVEYNNGPRSILRLLILSQTGRVQRLGLRKWNSLSYVRRAAPEGAKTKLSKLSYNCVRASAKSTPLFFCSEHQRCLSRLSASFARSMTMQHKVRRGMSWRIFWSQTFLMGSKHPRSML